MEAASQISNALSAALAMDIASDLYDFEHIARVHGVSEEHIQALMDQPWFTAMIRQHRRDWMSVKSTPERIRIKAAHAVEETLPDVAMLVRDLDSPGAARVSAFKELVGLSGAARIAEEDSGRTAPVVNIILGDDKTISIGAKSPGQMMDVTPGNDDGWSDDSEAVSTVNWGD